VLSVLRFTDSDCTFGIFKLFLLLFLCGFLNAIILSGLFIFLEPLRMKCHISLVVLNMQFTFIVVVKSNLKRLTSEQKILNKERIRKIPTKKIFLRSQDSICFISYESYYSANCLKIEQCIYSYGDSICNPYPTLTASVA